MERKKGTDRRENTKLREEIDSFSLYLLWISSIYSDYGSVFYRFHSYSFHCDSPFVFLYSCFILSTFVLEWRKRGSTEGFSAVMLILPFLMSVYLFSIWDVKRFSDFSFYIEFTIFLTVMHSEMSDRKTFQHPSYETISRCNYLNIVQNELLDEIWINDRRHNDGCNQWNYASHFMCLSFHIH